VVTVEDSAPEEDPAPDEDPAPAPAPAADDPELVDEVSVPVEELLEAEADAIAAVGRAAEAEATGEPPAGGLGARDDVGSPGVPIGIARVKLSSVMASNKLRLLRNDLVMI